MKFEDFDFFQSNSNHKVEFENLDKDITGRVVYSEFEHGGEYYWDIDYIEYDDDVCIDDEAMEEIENIFRFFSDTIFSYIQD